ncbi:MAG: hypothetical protein EB117_13360 [Betaproteobacteria bacterium]|nr:hypothetical protein [Betaproteobacteria bacterium]
MTTSVIHHMVQEVAKIFNTTPSAICSANRRRENVLARNIVTDIAYNDFLAAAEAKDYDPLLDNLWTIAQAEMDSWAKDGAFPYDKELLNLLMQTGNMKAMSRETGIPYRSIIYSIEQAKAKIKTAIEANGYTGLSHPD